MPNDQPDWISPTAQVQRELGSLTPAAGQTLAQSFPVPTECQCLGFLVDLKNGIFIPTNLTVQGDQTGLFYFNTTTPTGIINLEHRALADTSVTMTVQSPAGGAAKVRLLAYTAHPIVSVRNVSNTPLTVDVTDRAGRQLGDIVDRAARQVGQVRVQSGDGATIFQGAEGTGALRVTHLNSSPAPWQAPNLSAGYSTGSLAAAGVISIQAGGGANVRTRLFKVTVSVSGVALVFGSVECPSGTIRAQWNGQSDRFQEFDFGGLDCGLNADVVLRNQSGAASGFIQGHAAVSQT